MKIFYIITLFLFPIHSIGQNKIEEIYFGGTQNLTNELSIYLAEKVNTQLDDTAHILFVKISAANRVRNSGEIITFDFFEKDSLFKKSLLDFFMTHKSKWNYKKLKKVSAILPIFITSYRKDFNKIFVNWSSVLNGGFQENQLAYFIKPLFIQLYCCPSSPSRDF